MSNAQSAISTKKVAVQFTHTLSRTSKMPCKSYGLPAAECNVGSKLRNVPGSTCEGCYAHEGCYAWEPSQVATYKRLESLQNAEWVTAMTKMLDGETLFRWHDSGDLQDWDHLLKVMTVVKRTPNIHHWLPTREAKLIKQYVRQYALPDNITVRLSAAMVDGKAPDVPEGVNTSTVHKDAPAEGFECPAPKQNDECRDCRACWDASIPNVSYAKRWN